MLIAESWPGLQPSPCFSNFLARTTFVLESLREAKNPGQDAFFWDLRSFLSNFWGFTHFIVDASVLSPHESSAWSTLSLYVNKCLSRSWTNGLFFIQGNWQLGHFQTFLGRRTKTTVISACEMFLIQLDPFRGLSGALVTFFQLPWGPGRMSL